ncbi:MAG TPA: phosphoserine phosphatase SerB [Stellaceae bacterium]|nr:phosphoserine phosphatase SerB [Stellaceae bacterium]
MSGATADKACMSDGVLTLIAGSGGINWARALLVARTALEPLGAHLEPVDWLAPERAADLGFEGVDPEQAEAAVRVALAREIGDLPLDLIAQPRDGRRKRLLVADMEATIIANEMLDELADILGLGPGVAAVTQRAMNGEIDFATALQERVALLEGAPAMALDEAAHRIRVNPGAAELVATMRAGGAYTALASGGFRCFTRVVKARLGFDVEIANELLVADGRITGRVQEPILGREAKLATLNALAADRRLALADTIAVGDGANDLAMLEAAGIGVAYHAKPITDEQARHRVRHADLTALLYAQGYREGEIKRS